MNLRLTRPAIRQLDRILTYIEARNPQGARKVQGRLQTVMTLISEHPHAGHATEREGVRRIAATPYPYAMTYRVEDDKIVVLSVRHTARRALASNN